MCVSAGGIHSFDWLRRRVQIHFFFSSSSSSYVFVYCNPHLFNFNPVLWEILKPALIYFSKTFPEGARRLGPEVRGGA